MKRVYRNRRNGRYEFFADPYLIIDKTDEYMNVVLDKGCNFKYNGWYSQMVLYDVQENPSRFKVYILTEDELLGYKSMKELIS